MSCYWIMAVAFKSYFIFLQAGRGLQPRSKRFELLKSSYFIKHCENIRSGVTNPAPREEKQGIVILTKVDDTGS